MTTKVVKGLKYVGLLSAVFFANIACEKEIESIGVNIVDNNNFSTELKTQQVVATNVDIEKVIANPTRFIPTNIIPQYLLGLYSDAEFGGLKASIVSQLNISATGDTYKYGDNTAIDSVLINIPYQATKEDNESDGKPKFSIDSVFGDSNEKFKLSVYRLNTFLNTLDPNEPTKNIVYYSDKEFQRENTALYSENIKLNPSDTAIYIKRYLLDGETVYDIDTIKRADVSPSLSIPLDEDVIKQLFVDNASEPQFASNDAFHQFFKGFYLEAEEFESENSHLVSLNMSNAKMTIYYSNDEDEGTDQDLNGNGTNGEQGVRVKHSYDFPFGSIKSNVYKRNKTSIKASGEDRLYVQGAAGSKAKIDLFTEEELTTVRNSFGEYGWLITEAKLTLYVDQEASSNIAPELLFIYNNEETSQVRDYLTEGISDVGGRLERDSDGKPYKYVFKITDYISGLLLKNEAEALELIQLGLKVYNPTDIPTGPTDTAVKDFSWNPKGVVLFGNIDAAGEKKVKLEISYSEFNNN